MTGASANAARMRAEAASTESESSGSAPESASFTRSRSPCSWTAVRKASVVTVKPGGTGNPARVSRERLTALPPTSSSVDGSSKKRTQIIALFYM